VLLLQGQGLDALRGGKRKNSVFCSLNVTVEGLLLQVSSPGKPLARRRRIVLLLL
jgi:hypothetical protein